MNICGIVCEYNPFHNGHLYQIEETKRRGADGIVCIMSGNFVQRGDFAIMQKHARAEAAIRCGADVVIELPLPWAIASAERFAYGAVGILHCLGAISHISFGTEAEDISGLRKIAEILTSENFNKALLEEYSKGASYAAARESALDKIDKSLSQLISTPNNILAIEYLKALLHLSSDISPIAIPRRGAEHDGEATSGGIASASLIRDCIENNADVSCYMPRASYDAYINETAKSLAPVFLKNADAAIMSVLKRMSSDDFTRYCDVSEGLENRLLEAVSQSTTLEEAIQKAKTKRYAYSRLRRTFINAFLDVRADMSEGLPPYAHILAFNGKGREIIKNFKKTASITIISRVADIKSESKKAQDLFALEARSDDIYSLFSETPAPQGSLYTKSPIYIED